MIHALGRQICNVLGHTKEGHWAKEGLTPPPKTTIASKKLSVRLLGISSGSLNMDGMSISITNTDI